MNALALFRENPYPDEEEIKEFLSGNLSDVQVMRDS